MTLDVSDVSIASGRITLQLDVDASGNVSEMTSLLAQEHEESQSSSSRSTIHTSLDMLASASHVDSMGQLLNAPLDIFEIPESALEVASARGQLQVVQTLLDDGAHPDYSYWFESTTPLIAAARTGHLEIARVLLQAGADVSISKDWGQMSAIKAAAETSEVVMLELLLEAVTNSATAFDPSDHEDVMSAQDTQKYSTRLSEKSKFLERAQDNLDAALVVAGEAGNMVILQKLLNAGADVNAHGAIAAAAAAGHLDVMIKLIQAATHQQNIPRETITRALQCAADEGHVLMVQPLLRAGADAAKIDIEKAAAEGHIGILTSLVQAFGDDETVLRCYRSVKALHLATRNGHKAIVDLLLAVGTDVNAASKENGDTAVPLAVAGGHTAIIKRLIDAGADLNAPPKCSWDLKVADTALQAAARSGSMTTLEMLLAAGAHVDTAEKKQYDWNKTALSVAAECDKPEIVARLLSLMSADDARQSAPAALERAVENHHTHIVRQLLQLHINVDSELYGPHRRTLLQAAAKNGNVEILKILVTQNADVNLNPSGGYSNTALQYASQRGSLDAVKLLLAAGAEVNVVGATAPPILLAVGNGHIPVFDHLLAVGADINLTAYRGQTITQAARASSNTEMLKRVRAALESRSAPKELQPPARGTGPLCTTCRVPGFLMDLFGGKTQDVETLHPSLPSLRASACAGCPFCCFLWKQLGTTSIVLPQPSPVQLFSGLSRGTLGCQIDEPFPIDAENPDNLAVHFSYATEPVQGETPRFVKHTGHKLDINGGLEYRRLITEDTSSSETYRQMKRWLKTCDEGHLKCQVAIGSPFIPTRLIYLDSPTDLVGDNSLSLSFLPRLVSTKGIELSSTKYMALSYRWPEDFPDEAKSTRNTILDHMQGLVVSKLPLGFNNLFQVAARLKVSYVWIDSLCIIQDDQEDWNREAALMSQIYQNAYLTVANAVPQNLPGKALFHNGDPPETLTQRLLCPLEDGSSQEVVLMKAQAETYHQSPLILRGWCFQEREISQRVVHYTKTQVLWECRTLRASESLPKGSTSLENLATHKWDKRMFDRDLGGGRVNNAWRRAVEDYSSRNLTKATDKLPALAGLAAAMRDRKLKSCRYLAGLWEDDIACGLAWVPRHQGYKDKCFGRYLDYIAPTWSWASVTGPVSYDTHIEDEDLPPDAHERKENVSDYTLQILDVCVQTLTADPFGAVRHATLRCSARLLPAVLARGRRHGSCKGGLSGCMNEEVPLKTDSGERIDGMNFDVREEEYDGKGITSIFCVCLGVLTSRSSYSCPAGPALAVIPTLVRDNEYRRVGIAPEMRFSHFDSARVEEITII